MEEGEVASTLTSIPFARPLVKCERGGKLYMNIIVAILQSVTNSLHYTLTHCLKLYLNQLEDEPCMVILVPNYLKRIVVEYIITVMGCCTSSNQCMKRMCVASLPEFSFTINKRRKLEYLNIK